MWTFAGAVLAVCGVLIAAYINNFVAEDYRRYKDRITIAAALAGELESYREGLLMMRPILQELSDFAKGGHKLLMPKFEPPNDPIYDASIAKLGLLGRRVVRDLTFTYQNIRAFRTVFAGLSDPASELPYAAVVAQFASCLQCLDRAEAVGAPLLDQLDAISREHYRITLGKWSLTSIR